MLVILNKDKSSSKFYFRMCHQLAVMDREKSTACSQEPELCHRMLTNDLYYLLFGDQAIGFISYIFHSNYLINALKCTIHASSKQIVPHFQCKF